MRLCNTRQEFAGGGLWDGAVDWTAVALGALTAAAIWQHGRRLMLAAVAGLLVVLGVGVSRRERPADPDTKP